MRRIIGSVSLLLVFAISVGTMSACGHVHIFVDKHDEALHRCECSCAEIVDAGAHIGGTATRSEQAV